MTVSLQGEGRVVDGTYALEECLGSGGMGSVYRARHVLLNKVFALKLMHPLVLQSKDGLARFEVEAKALGRLEHPSIVRVTDYGVDTASGGAPYLVMEYLEGEALKDFMERDGPVGPDTALPLLEAVAEGLDYAHEQGVLHRDLKPHNVILARDAAGRVQARIVDFGLARFVAGAADRVVTQTIHPGLLDRPDLALELDSVDTQDTMALAGAVEQPPQELRANAMVGSVADISTGEGSVPTGLTRAGTLVGTAGYMAPEVADSGGALPASDVYSFGVLAYELLVGKKPFTGSFMALLRAHVFDQPPAPSTVNPALSPELDAAILAPLAKVPGERPRSAGEAVRGLRAAWEREQDRRWRRRELPRRLLASLAVAVTGAGLAMLATGWAVVGDVESRLVDLRFLVARPRPPHPQLALVMLDDATLEADPAHRAIVDYDSEVAAVLERALQAGATGVGLDMVLDHPQWRDALAGLLLEYHDRFVLALHWDVEKREYKGAELVEGVVTTVLGPERSAAMLGLVNLDQDRDGATRRMRAGAREEGGAFRPTFAARVAEVVRGSSLTDAEREDTFWVDYRVDWTAIPRWSWKDLATVVAERPEAVRGRFLMVGGDIEGYGDTSYPMPHPAGLPAEAPGVVVQALVTNTLLDGRPLRGPSPWLSALTLACLAPLTMAALWRRRLVIAISLTLAVPAAHLAAAVGLFVVGGRLVPVAAVVLVFPLAAAAAVGLRWRLPARPQGAPEEHRRLS